MVNKYQKIKKASKQSKGKVPKSFWRRSSKKLKKRLEIEKILSEEEKDKKRQYHWDQNKNLS